MSKPKICTPTDSYVTTYQWAVDYTQQQQAIFWPAEEPGVEEDEHDFRTKLNEAELHGVLTAQSILTKYEVMIGGEEFWGGTIAKMFPRPEIQRMCACFSNVELNSHAPFYSEANKVMGNDTDEFYTRWIHDKHMTKRIETMTRYSQSGDELLTTAALAFFEGAILYSAFGFFKGFNSSGFNLIPHFVAGIDGSAKDEDIHSKASAYLHNTYLQEAKELGLHSEQDELARIEAIDIMSKECLAHEEALTKELFAITGNRVVSKQQVTEFFEDRVDIVRARLGLPKLHNRKEGEISKWFYDQLSTVKVPDFFATTQLQYRRDIEKHKISFKMELVK